MPRWSRDRATDRERYPDERWQASCPAAFVPLLSRHDHHVVWIEGRPALLLTYHWTIDDAGDDRSSRVLDVSFTYPARHPRAPRDVQAVVDQLTFTPVDSTTRDADDR